MELVGLSKSGRELYSSPPEEINVKEGRIREAFPKKELEELQDSIKDKGQLQPGICKIEEGKLFLVAGERRLRCCLKLQIPYEFVLTTETDPLRIEEIELDENIKRNDLTFQERAKATLRKHALRQQLNPSVVGRLDGRGGQTLADTAKELDRSIGDIATEIKLAKFLEIPEVRNAPNRTEALKIIKRIEDDYARSVALKEAQAFAKGQEGQEENPQQEEGLSMEERRKRALADKINFYLPKVREGRMEEILEEFPDESFNIVLFDPPWGQDLETVEEVSGSKVGFDDSPERFSNNLAAWLRILHRKMAVNSHLYMFFGIKDHLFVYQLLEKVGFVVNYMPLIWYKQGAHRVRTPKIWPGRSYEPIAFARKGAKDLCWLGAPDCIITQAPTPAMKGSHMAGKHPDVYLNLLKRSAFPGDKILDPMAGTGMSGVACEVLRATHQLDFVLIEEKEEFCRLAISNLVKGYSNISFCGAAEASKEDFEELCDCDESNFVEGPLAFREMAELVVERGNHIICTQCKKKLTVQRAKQLII